MIHYVIGVVNSNVLVVLNEQLRTVTVQNNRSKEYKMFDGPGDMQEKYYDFEENITEDTDYDAAINYFSLQFLNMTITTKYDLKQLVYLVHDPEQLQRMVTGINIITPKLVSYQLSCGADTSDHYEYELAAERNAAMTILQKQE